VVGGALFLDVTSMSRIGGGRPLSGHTKLRAAQQHNHLETNKLTPSPPTQPINQQEDTNLETTKFAYSGCEMVALWVGGLLRKRQVCKFCGFQIGVFLLVDWLRWRRWC
jgi:hypothetical protein